MVHKRKKMSDDPVDQPLPGNDNNQGQIGNGGGNQMIPLGIRIPFPPRHAGRILVIENQTDIVRALSTFSMVSNQPIYVISGTGYVSQANLVTLPSLQGMTAIGRGKIRYMSGWFQPVIQSGGHSGAPLSCANGVLHVSISGAVQQNVCLVTSLIASGTVEVCVTFACGPLSMVQPGPPEPRRLKLPQL